jgi:hypothetical protein
MNADTTAAVSFLATHGRVLDRRRLERLLGDPGTEAVLAALDGYRNPDGGYGWGLEPDLRSSESQPTAAMHAFEVMAEIAPATTPRAVELCDWLDRHSLADGGLPLALPLRDPAGCAPWWAGADPTTSSLQMTAQVAACAHLVARHDSRVRDHPWLARATGWCLDAIARVDVEPHAIELLFAIRFLDALGDADAGARDLLDRLARFLPPNGVVHVEGGADEEHLRPLDFAPRPGTPARELFTDDVLAAELDRLASRQQPDGGWVVDFAAASPAAALEWRGYATVSAIAVLLAG